jgi:hypothetical protein
MTLSKGELSGLVERVRGLKGPDREVNAAICIALQYGGPNSEDATNVRTDPDWDDGDLVFEIGNEDCCNPIPDLTGSADAALALVERVQPGWKRSLFEKRGGGWVSRISSPRWETYSSGEDTPLPAAPIALTLALLLSLQSQEPTP